MQQRPYHKTAQLLVASAACNNVLAAKPDNLPPPRQNTTAFLPNIFFRCIGNMQQYSCPQNRIVFPLPEPHLAPSHPAPHSSHLILSLLAPHSLTPPLLVPHTPHLASPPRILHLTPRILHLAPRKKGRPNNRAAFSTGIREAIVPLRDRPPECGRNIRR